MKSKFYTPLFSVTHEVSREVFLSLFTPETECLYFCVAVASVEGHYFACKVFKGDDLNSGLIYEVNASSRLWYTISKRFKEGGHPNLFFFRLGFLNRIERDLTLLHTTCVSDETFCFLYESDLFSVFNS